MADVTSEFLTSTGMGAPGAYKPIQSRARGSRGDGSGFMWRSKHTLILVVALVAIAAVVLAVVVPIMLVKKHEDTLHGPSSGLIASRPREISYGVVLGREIRASNQAPPTPYQELRYDLQKWNTAPEALYIAKSAELLSGKTAFINALKQRKSQRFGSPLLRMPQALAGGQLDKGFSMAESGHLALVPGGAFMPRKPFGGTGGALTAGQSNQVVYFVFYVTGLTTAEDGTVAFSDEQWIMGTQASFMTLSSSGDLSFDMDTEMLATFYEPTEYNGNDITGFTWRAEVFETLPSGWEAGLFADIDAVAVETNRPELASGVYTRMRTDEKSATPGNFFGGESASSGFDVLAFNMDPIFTQEGSVSSAYTGFRRKLQMDDAAVRTALGYSTQDVRYVINYTLSSSTTTSVTGPIGTDGTTEIALIADTPNADWGAVMTVTFFVDMHDISSNSSMLLDNSFAQVAYGNLQYDATSATYLLLLQTNTVAFQPTNTSAQHSYVMSAIPSSATFRVFDGSTAVDVPVNEFLYKMGNVSGNTSSLYMSVATATHVTTQTFSIDKTTDVGGSTYTWNASTYNISVGLSGDSSQDSYTMRFRIHKQEGGSINVNSDRVLLESFDPVDSDAYVPYSSAGAISFQYVLYPTLTVTWGVTVRMYLEPNPMTGYDTTTHVTVEDVTNSSVLATNEPLQTASDNRKYIVLLDVDTITVSDEWSFTGTDGATETGMTWSYTFPIAVADRQTFTNTAALNT
jgi:hypothetical protein